MATPEMHALHAHLDSLLSKIAKRFKNPKITLIVRNPDIGDTADVVLTDETDYDLPIAALRRAADPAWGRSVGANAEERVDKMLNYPKTLAEAHAYRYGQWSGNERGNRYRPAQCAAEVPIGGRSYLYRQCPRDNGYGPDKLYCKSHARKAGR